MAYYKYWKQFVDLAYFILRYYICMYYHILNKVHYLWVFQVSQKFSEFIPKISGGLENYHVKLIKMVFIWYHKRREVTLFWFIKKLSNNWHQRKAQSGAPCVYIICNYVTVALDLAIHLTSILISFLKCNKWFFFGLFYNRAITKLMNSYNI